MAISKIHPIRYSVLDAVNYITNPDKTDGKLLVSSYACCAPTADLEFADTASYGKHRGDVKAQHLIQAFAPGEVSAELAHEIGKKFAMEVTEGKYEFVLATHVDKDHIHNHIIFNQVDFIDHKKYRGNIYCQREIARINDEICSSYGLSIIKNKEAKAVAYHEYKDLKTNNSNRQVLKNTIDSLIPLANSYDELLEMLKKLDYEIKITNANCSIKKEGSQRYIRLKNLGDKYTPEAISKRITYKNVDASPYIAPPKAEFGLLKDLSDRLDMIKNPAYQNKVALSEVKRVAATYAFLNEHGLSSISKISEQQSAWNLSIKEKRAEIKKLEDMIDNDKNILEALELKEKYNSVYAAYIKAGKSNEFKKEHATQMAIFEAQCKFLYAKGVSTDTKSEEVRTRLSELTAKKDALYESYHSDVSDLKQLNIAARNLEMIMNDKQIGNVKKREQERII